ncbi:MAG TPA: class I tRNA ligase family protein [Thermoplasmata archaeon]|nr:class I tRNA ligase family protein [Thermoplasmata archaeon]
MDLSRARHWQDAWASAGVATARRVSGHGKFYALVAYPGTSGFLHVGHLRQYAYADALHRYHRMLGEEVFFPFGTHASGLPAVAWAQKVQDRDPATIAQLEDEGVPASEWPRLEAPEEAARFLGGSYRRVLRSMGVLVDPTTYLTTIDDDYRAFIRWQFRALREAGGLVQGTHFASVCPVCGPVAVDAAETDLATGGDAEIVRFVTVPFRLDDGRILLAATLRPETVYGVTNLWLPPHGSLVVWHHGDTSYLVGRPGAERLVEQHGGRIGHEVPVGELLGREANPPVRSGSVPILASPIVDPEIGTGVVMSVPAHAPADLAALTEVTPDVRARLGLHPVLLGLDAEPPLSPSDAALAQGPGTPAERALRATGARGLSDREAVDVATERLYRLEFVRGRMTIPEMAGVRVREAREQVTQQLASQGSSFMLQEFSVPVRCRNGHTVVIRRVPDQWFLHYGDPAWKAETRALLPRLTTSPAEYGEELPSILDWFDDRPCIRKGRWLGSPFPFDPEWVIEPIADSTFYTAYFIVRRMVADGRIPPTALTDAFFDRVFRGRGPGEPSLDRAVQEEARAEFLYWYPVDFNIGGKEHKRVHFPVYLYTHAKLLPPELGPRGIFVTHWITGAAGAKLSKKEISKKGRGIPPIASALDEWGPDALRLYHLIAASPSQDTEWNAELVATAVERLAEVERLVRAASGDGEGPPGLDAWLFSEMHGQIARIRTAYDGLDVRAAAEATCIAIPTLLKRYYTRGGAPGRATAAVAAAWVRLLSPIAPHLAEELGSTASGGLVATSPFPSPAEFPRSPDAEVREQYLARVEEDLRAIVRLSTDRKEPPPTEAVFFVAAPWKGEVEAWMREAVAAGDSIPVRAVMERATRHPEIAAFRAEVPKYVQRIAPLLRSETATATPPDEASLLRSAEGYLARRFGFSTVLVVLEGEAAPHDPLNRRERSRPGRPAFYLRRHDGG